MLIEGLSTKPLVDAFFELCIHHSIGIVLMQEFICEL